MEERNGTNGSATTPGHLSSEAETGGFEPPEEFYPLNRLAGGCFRPLSHVSADHPSQARSR